MTRRYVRNILKYGLERTRVPEAVLHYIIAEIRANRRANMSKQDKFRLQGEDMREERELRYNYITAIAQEICKINPEDILKPGNGAGNRRADPDAQKAAEGRQSGEAEWIRRRGEGGRGTPGHQNENPPDLPPR